MTVHIDTIVCCPECRSRSCTVDVQRKRGTAIIDCEACGYHAREIMDYDESLIIG